MNKGLAYRYLPRRHEQHQYTTARDGPARRDGAINARGNMVWRDKRLCTITKRATSCLWSQSLWGAWMESCVGRAACSVATSLFLLPPEPSVIISDKFPISQARFKAVFIHSVLLCDR